MAINNATKKTKGRDSGRASKANVREVVLAEDTSTSKRTNSAPLSGFQDRAATLRLYVKNKELLKEAKLAALEDDTSLSQLWEDWAVDWLRSRKK